jgi:hypothetical protein
VKRILPAILLVLSASLAGADRGLLCFQVDGQAFAFDPSTEKITPSGSFSPAAPSVQFDPQGLLWGRLDPNLFAAWDPATGAWAAKIPLRFQPFRHLITTDGKAYITHHTTTLEGFTISVVDTRSRRLLGEIRGVNGLPLDMVAAEGDVFLTARGVAGDDYLRCRLYRIETLSGRLQELRRASESGWYWKVAASPSALFLCCLPKRGTDQDALIEVIALGSLASVRTIRIGDLLGPGRYFQHLLFEGPWGLMVFQDSDGVQWLAVTDSTLDRVRSVFPLGRSVYDVVGASGDFFFYLSRSQGSGNREFSLISFSAREGKEVKEAPCSGFPAP